jgi:simple sugar transport system ATP-binding protein
MLGEGGEAEPRRAGRITPAGDRVRVRATGLKAGRLREASFAIQAGELVGIAAVEGNGQRELLRAIAGLARPEWGSLEVQGPVALIPEDRTVEALINEFQLAENLVLSQGSRAPWIRGPWVDWSQARRRTAELISQYGVRASGPEAPAGSLSGGNQQRMVIAEALERQPAVLLAENPTRGLDIRATSEVLARLKEAASSGVAVLVHLGDLDELLALASRILVLTDGVLSEMPAESSREEIGRRMLGAGGRGT